MRYDFREVNNIFRCSNSSFGSIVSIFLETIDADVVYYDSINRYIHFTADKFTGRIIKRDDSEKIPNLFVWIKDEEGYGEGFYYITEKNDKLFVNGGYILDKGVILSELNCGYDANLFRVNGSYMDISSMTKNDREMLYNRLETSPSFAIELQEMGNKESCVMNVTRTKDNFYHGSIEELIALNYFIAENVLEEKPTNNPKKVLE